MCGCRGRDEVAYLLLSHAEYDPLVESSVSAAVFGGVGSSDLPGAPALFSREAADVNLCPVGAHTPLCSACLRGNDVMTTLLLRYGAAVNALGKKDQSALVVAARAGQLAVVRTLLRRRLPRALAEAVDQEAAAQDEIFARKEQRRALAAGAVDSKVVAASKAGRSLKAALASTTDTAFSMTDKSLDSGAGSPVIAADGSAPGPQASDDADPLNPLFKLLSDAEESDEDKRPGKDEHGAPPRSPRGVPSHFDARKRQREQNERMAALARDAAAPTADTNVHKVCVCVAVGVCSCV